MKYFGRFYLDKEKDMIVELFLEGEEMFFCLRTLYHHSGNLITNLARLCDLPVSEDENGLKVIRGQVPCYIDAYNQKIYIFRLGGTKTANIYPDGRIEMKASVPSISKTLMSQTKDYRLNIERTIIKTYIFNDCKFRTDLHTHMNANLEPDILIALGIVHQIRYPLYYIKKLGLELTQEQWDSLTAAREKVSLRYQDSELTGKYLERRIDDHTYLNFADLILGNLSRAEKNISRIRTSLAVMKDGQAVFTNLEKVYLYRYVFTKGKPAERPIVLSDTECIPDEDVRSYVGQMLQDKRNKAYKDNTLYQDTLLWIARRYQRRGIRYVEISDTSLVKKEQAAETLAMIHEVMPAVYAETGVRIRFLAAIRRIPLTIIRDKVASADYWQENLRVLEAVCHDPYVAGSDIVGEEINDILELKPVIRQLVKIAAEEPSFVIRIHAGENDSLRDNVANSIQCVKESLAEGQSMPRMRIGHGLYTCNLNSEKGRRLISAIKENDVVLEFQITSNVRLNNLSSLSRHPLRAYLSAGISCVQGTDGGALYGTDSIDEQLSLEKLLGLSREDLLKMRQAEERVISEGEQAFAGKMQRMPRKKGKALKDYYEKRISSQSGTEILVLPEEKKLVTQEVLAESILEMPDSGIPIILAGGSFNNDRHRTVVREEARLVLDQLLEKGDPERIFFVIGHKLKGYEQYLVEHNHGKFQIFAFAPSQITKAEMNQLKASGLHVRVSIEASSMGLYKSIAYEIFKRRPSILLALDGNSAGANLIQEAKNAKKKAWTYVFRGSRALSSKAESLEGYITLFRSEKEVPTMILERIGKLEQLSGI